MKGQAASMKNQMPLRLTTAMVETLNLVVRDFAVIGVLGVRGASVTGLWPSARPRKLLFKIALPVDLVGVTQ